MTITLQGYLHRGSKLLLPMVKDVTCQDCRKPYDITGDESMEMEYDNAVDMEEYAESIELRSLSTLQHLGLLF